jgi:hypothetical protein
MYKSLASHGYILVKKKAIKGQVMISLLLWSAIGNSLASHRQSLADQN